MFLMLFPILFLLTSAADNSDPDPFPEPPEEMPLMRCATVPCSDAGYASAYFPSLETISDGEPYRLPQGPDMARYYVESRDLADTGSEPRPFTTARDEVPQESRAIDLVVIMDATGSMGNPINHCREQLRPAADELRGENVHLRVAFVAYRDVGVRTQVHDFTTNLDQFYHWANSITPMGGDDAPEDMVSGFLRASQLKYREGSEVHVLLFADAPPHGFGCIGDRFPDGIPALDPETNETADLMKIVKRFVEKQKADITFFKLNESTNEFERQMQELFASLTMQNAPRFQVNEILMARRPEFRPPGLEPEGEVDPRRSLDLRRARTGAEPEHERDPAINYGDFESLFGRSITEGSEPRIAEGSALRRAITDGMRSSLRRGEEPGAEP